MSGILILNQCLLSVMRKLAPRRPEHQQPACLGRVLVKRRAPEVTVNADVFLGGIITCHLARVGSTQNIDLIVVSFCILMDECSLQV